MKTIAAKLRSWKENKEYAKLTIVVLIALVIFELTVCNYHFYANIFNTPITNTVTMGGAVQKTAANEYSFGDGDKYFEFKDINEHIKNIHIDAEIKEEEKTNAVIKVVPSITDAGNELYFDLSERDIVYNIDETKYIPLNLNGDSEKIKINFKNCNNKTVVINSIELNAKVPFKFNALRIFGLYAIIALIYIIRPHSEFYRYVFNAKSKKQAFTLALIVLLNAGAILGLGLAHPSNNTNVASQNHQYRLLAEAITDGHFYLNETPPQSLVDMDNPYDRYKRDEVMKETGERYKWDTAYYDGKYYVYFGVVPELLFFLPANLMRITIINKVPVMTMCILAVIFGYLLIRELTRRWFKSTSFLTYILMSVLFVNTTGIFMAVRIPDIYMIPISHALAFSLMGLYLWLKALPEGEQTKLRGIFLFLGSLCMALVAGCRPQVVLASFIAVPIFWKAVFKDRELLSPKSIDKTVLFAVPYVVVAAFLMYYNYARFGNVFDFGQNYNLTTMDMVSEKFKFAKIPLSLFTNYFQPPAMEATFPFLRMAWISKNFMGNYVCDEPQYGGLLPCHIILLSLLFIPKVKNILKEKKLFAPTLLALITAVIITVVDNNIGGLVVRYMIDYMWLIFGAAVIVVLAFAQKYKGTPFVNLFNGFVATGFVWSMAYTFMLLFNINAASYKDTIPTLYYFVQRLIEFWI